MTDPADDDKFWDVVNAVLDQYEVEALPDPIPRFGERIEALHAEVVALAEQAGEYGYNTVADQLCDIGDMLSDVLSVYMDIFE